LLVHFETNKDNVLPENKPKLTANDRISDIRSCTIVDVRSFCTSIVGAYANEMDIKYPFVMAKNNCTTVENKSL
jgi:hypothetical protein